MSRSLDLLRHSVKAVSWRPLAPAAGLVVILAWVLPRQPVDLEARHLLLRLGLTVAAVWVAFLFDDPASTLAAATPTRLWIRRSVRVLLGFVPWAASVAILLIATGWQLEALGQPIPSGRFVAEACTMAIWALAIASVIAQNWDEEPGRLAAVIILSLSVTAWILPEPAHPWSLPGQPNWDTVGRWWSAALAIGVVVVVVFSWDSRHGHTSRGRRATTDTGLSKGQ